MHGKEFHPKKHLVHLLTFVSFLFLSGCQATLPKFMPPLEEEGEVYLYTQPFPQEAERLKFTMEGILAISNDGKEFPLTLSLAEIKASDTRRQRLLAFGRLPPGGYVEFSFKIR